MKTILKRTKIDYSTYILIFLTLLAGYIKNVFLILLIVLIHELGHVFFFLLFKIEVRKIVIYPYGGMSYVNKKINERIYRDILISMGGILFQILLYLFFIILFRNDIIVRNTFDLFKLYNIRIILFNIIPIIPLDGSKFILAFFSKFLSYRNSYRLMVIIGIISLILFISYNFIYRVNDLVLYIFLGYSLYKVIIEYKYVLNRFYLERILGNCYYNGIISNETDYRKMRIDKYYYFYFKGRFMKEKDYLRKYYFKKGEY